MKLIIALVVTLLTNDAYCSYDCIKYCACEKRGDLLIADCTGLNFTEIPQPQEYQINVLYLEFNHITRLRNGAFQLYNQLKELYLQGNKIAYIEEGAFAGLGSIEKLDLSMNMLSDVSRDNLIRISNNLSWLSLSMNGLREIPIGISVLRKLQELDLSSNHYITTISEGSLPASLTKLNLKMTEIAHFAKSSFKDLRNLKVLFLNDNMAGGTVDFEEGIFDEMIALEYIDLSRTYCRKLPRDSFKHLKNLETLLMQNSRLNQAPLLLKEHTRSRRNGREISSSTNDKSKHDTVTTTSPQNFITSTTNSHATEPQVTTVAGTTTHSSVDIWYNPRLANLDLSHNSRLSITTGVRFSPSLRSLRLGYTAVRKVNRTIFQDIPLIEKLDLSYSQIKSIDYDAFANFKNVSEICLSGNPLTSAPKLPSTLLSLNLSHTRITNLTRKILEDLTHVTRANLNDGQIGWIEDYALKNMTSLVYLDLSENKLDILTINALSVGCSPNMNGIILKEKSLSSIGAQSCGLGRTTKSKITEINLSTNVLRAIQGGAFATHGELRILDLQSNFLPEVGADTFVGLRNLVELRLNHNFIADIGPHSFTQLNNLEKLDLGYNNLEVIFKGTFISTTKLKHLSLKNNKITLFHPLSLDSLVYLDFSSNNLTTFPKISGKFLKDIRSSRNYIHNFQAGALDNVPNLERIDLSYSEITYLNYSVFRGTPVLRYLDLTENHIYNFLDKPLPNLQILRLAVNEVEFVQSRLGTIAPNLKRLELPYNNITYIHPDIFRGAHALRSLDLTGNNFQCTCDLLPLVQWIIHNKDTGGVDTVGAETYLCEGPVEEYTVPILVAVTSLDCSTPPTARKSGIFIGAIFAAVLILLLSFILLLLICKRIRISRRRREREQSDNDDSISAAEARRSSKGCCVPCKQWWMDMDSYKTSRGRHRGRIVSEERRDLMIASPVTTPTDTQAPESI